MNGFYGNITNTSKSPFEFDRIYPNRLAMDNAATSDNVYADRFVLVEYDKDFSNQLLYKAYRNTNDEKEGTNLILYKDVQCTLPIYIQDNRGEYKNVLPGTVVFVNEGELRTYYIDGSTAVNLMNNYRSTEDDSNYYIINEDNNTAYYVDITNLEEGEMQENATDVSNPMPIYYKGNYPYSYYKCNGSQLEETDIASFEYIQELESNPEAGTIDNYLANSRIDEMNYAEDKEGYDKTSVWKGYDSTVWQKIYVGSTEKYIMVANLNTEMPTMKISADAPSQTPQPPHFDPASTNAMYDLHYQVPWGFRIGAADQDLSTREKKYKPSISWNERTLYYTYDDINDQYIYEGRLSELEFNKHTFYEREITYEADDGTYHEDLEYYTRPNDSGELLTPEKAVSDIRSEMSRINNPVQIYTKNEIYSKYNNSTRYYFYEQASEYEDNVDYYIITDSVDEEQPRLIYAIDNTVDESTNFALNTYFIRHEFDSQNDELFSENKDEEDNLEYISIGNLIDVLFTANGQYFIAEQYRQVRNDEEYNPDEEYYSYNQELNKYEIFRIAPEAVENYILTDYFIRETNVSPSSYNSSQKYSFQLTGDTYCNIGCIPSLIFNKEIVLKENGKEYVTELEENVTYYTYDESENIYIPVEEELTNEDLTGDIVYYKDRDIFTRVFSYEDVNKDFYYLRDRTNPTQLQNIMELVDLNDQTITGFEYLTKRMLLVGDYYIYQPQYNKAISTDIDVDNINSVYYNKNLEVINLYDILMKRLSYYTTTIVYVESESYDAAKPYYLYNEDGIPYKPTESGFLTEKEYFNIDYYEQEIYSDEKTDWQEFQKGSAYHYNSYNNAWEENEAEEVANVDAAIYYNKAGFNSDVRSKVEGVEDIINITPTGFGQELNLNNEWVNKKYNDEESLLYGGKKDSPDTQELEIKLPSIGNTISDIWDLAYSEERNKNIQWNNTTGLRLVTSENDTSYKYNKEAVETIAGCINSVHDLMGQIIVDAPDTAEDKIIIAKEYKPSYDYYLNINNEFINIGTLTEEQFNQNGVFDLYKYGTDYAPAESYNNDVQYYVYTGNLYQPVYGLNEDTEFKIYNYYFKIDEEYEPADLIDNDLDYYIKNSNNTYTLIDDISKPTNESQLITYTYFIKNQPITLETFDPSIGYYIKNNKNYFYVGSINEKLVYNYYFKIDDDYVEATYVDEVMNYYIKDDNDNYLPTVRPTEENELFEQVIDNKFVLYVENRYIIEDCDNSHIYYINNNKFSFKTKEFDYTQVKEGDWITEQEEYENLVQSYEPIDLFDSSNISPIYFTKDNMDNYIYKSSNEDDNAVYYKIIDGYEIATKWEEGIQYYYFNPSTEKYIPDNTVTEYNFGLGDRVLYKISKTATPISFEINPNIYVMREVEDEIILETGEDDEILDSTLVTHMKYFNTDEDIYDSEAQYFDISNSFALDENNQLKKHYLFQPGKYYYKKRTLDDSEFFQNGREYYDNEFSEYPLNITNETYIPNRYYYDAQDIMEFAPVDSLDQYPELNTFWVQEIDIQLVIYDENGNPTNLGAPHTFPIHRSNLVSLEEAYYIEENEEYGNVLVKATEDDFDKDDTDNVHSISNVVTGNEIINNEKKFIKQVNEFNEVKFYEPDKYHYYEDGSYYLDTDTVGKSGSHYYLLEPELLDVTLYKKNKFYYAIDGTGVNEGITFYALSTDDYNVNTQYYQKPKYYVTNSHGGYDLGTIWNSSLDWESYTLEPSAQRKEGVQYFFDEKGAIPVYFYNDGHQYYVDSIHTLYELDQNISGPTLGYNYFKDENGTQPVNIWEPNKYYIWDNNVPVLSKNSYNNNKTYYYDSALQHQVYFIDNGTYYTKQLSQIIKDTNAYNNSKAYFLDANGNEPIHFETFESNTYYYKQEQENVNYIVPSNTVFDNGLSYYNSVGVLQEVVPYTPNTYYIKYYTLAPESSPVAGTQYYELVNGQYIPTTWEIIGEGEQVQNTTYYIEQHKLDDRTVLDPSETYYSDLECTNIVTNIYIPNLYYIKNITTTTSYILATNYDNSKEYYYDNRGNNLVYFVNDYIPNKYYSCNYEYVQSTNNYSPHENYYILDGSTYIPVRVLNSSEYQINQYYTTGGYRLSTNNDIDINSTTKILNHYQDNEGTIPVDDLYIYRPGEFYYSREEDAHDLVDTENTPYSQATTYYLEEILLDNNNMPYKIYNKVFVRNDWESNKYYYLTDLHSQTIKGVHLVNEKDLHIIYSLTKLDGFAKKYNTIHGLILGINQLLGNYDPTTRNTSTVTGALNRMNDEINRISSFSVEEMYSLSGLVEELQNQLEDAVEQINEAIERLENNDDIIESAINSIKDDIIGDLAILNEQIQTYNENRVLNDKQEFSAKTKVIEHLSSLYEDIDRLDNDMIDINNRFSNQVDEFTSQLSLIETKMNSVDSYLNLFNEDGTLRAEREEEKSQSKKLSTNDFSNDHLNALLSLIDKRNINFTFQQDTKQFDKVNSKVLKNESFILPALNMAYVSLQIQIKFLSKQLFNANEELDIGYFSMPGTSVGTDPDSVSDDDDVIILSSIDASLNMIRHNSSTGTKYVPSEGRRYEAIMGATGLHIRDHSSNGKKGAKYIFDITGWFQYKLTDKEKQVIPQGMKMEIDAVKALQSDIIQDTAYTVQVDKIPKSCATFKVTSGNDIVEGSDTMKSFTVGSGATIKVEVKPKKNCTASAIKITSLDNEGNAISGASTNLQIASTGGSITYKAQGPIRISAVTNAKQYTLKLTNQKIQTSKKGKVVSSKISGYILDSPNQGTTPGTRLGAGSNSISVGDKVLIVVENVVGFSGSKIKYGSKSKEVITACSITDKPTTTKSKDWNEWAESIKASGKGYIISSISKNLSYSVTGGKIASYTITGDYATGYKVKLKRTKSTYKGAKCQSINFNSTVYYNDVIQVSLTPKGNKPTTRQYKIGSNAEVNFTGSSASFTVTGKPKVTIK